MMYVCMHLLQTRRLEQRDEDEGCELKPHHNYNYKECVTANDLSACMCVWECVAYELRLTH